MSTPKEEVKDQAHTFLDRGHAHLKRFDFNESEVCLRTAIDLLESHVDDSDRMLIDALAVLASVYIETARFDEAEALLDRALAGVEKSGSDPMLMALLTNNKAGALREAGRTREALATFRRAAEIDPEEMGYAQAIENAALCLSEMEQFAEADPLFVEALRIRLKHLPESHPIVVRNMNNLGLLQHRVGNYGSASVWFDKAVALLGRQRQTTPLRATILNNRALLSQELGDFDTAAALFREALRLLTPIFGEQHPDTLMVLSNYGMLLSDSGHYDEAEPLLNHVADIWEKLGRPRDHATSVNILGLLYLRMRRFPEAKTFLQRAIELNEAPEADATPFQITIAQSNLALVFLQTGELDAAQRLLTAVLAKRREVLSSNHPMIEQALFNLATVVARIGNLSEARQLLDEAAEIDEAALDQVFSTAADPQRSAFLRTLRLRWNLYLSIVRRDGSPDAIRAGMNFVLRRRALGIEALVIQATMATEDDQAPTALRFRQLNRLRREAAEAELAIETEEKSARLVELARQAEALERELAAETPGLRLAARVRKADVDLVRTAMLASSALIEFARVDADDFGFPSRGEEQTDARYVAFVLRGGSGSKPELVDLGSVDKLEHEIRAYLATISKPYANGTHAQTAEARAGKRLYRTIWQPLSATITGCARLIMAADGELARLPLSVLPIGGGLRLIDEFAISHVTSGRDLLLAPLGGGPTNPSAPLVLGDPDYDACVEGMVGDRLADLGPSNDGLSAIRSSELRFAPLPATRGEAEVISALLKVPPHIGQMASYGTLSKTRSPLVLHIATHGFFLEDLPGDASLSYGAENPRMMRLSASENPLLRSGLALAGANVWLQDRDPGPELGRGIITAAELATLNLRDTFLVTLSACETELGVVRAGEGVFGLQRACILAGAKTVVMSLWSVPDLATAELMKSFYGNIIAGQPVEAALRGAQQTLRQIYPDPLSWGAFIVLGAASATRVPRLATEPATR